MKKAITILAVLIVLVSAVFAAETHKLTVKADVTETLPAFNLSYSTKNTNTVATNVYGTNQLYDATGTGDAAADAGFNLNANGSFVVTAQVINAVKTNRIYTLEFKGGVFDVTRDTTSGKLSPKQITVADAHTAADTSVKTVAKVSDSTELTAEQTRADDPTALSAKARVTFSGKTGTGTPAAAKPIAAATYSYLGDDDIDPTTTANPWYYADIILVITEGSV
jgi:hypothetical protein